MSMRSSSFHDDDDNVDDDEDDDDDDDVGATSISSIAFFDWVMAVGDDDGED
jgi:hypothetical protein